MRKIDWKQPFFPAYCLWAMTVTAYGGLRDSNLDGLIAAAGWLLIAWATQYLDGEKQKALPKESYLVD